MLKEVKTGTKRLNDYRGIIDDSLFREINSLAKKLQDLKVLHINATDSGGGVAEILQNLVPLMRNIGINAKWKIISADKSFFNITKSFHNALQGNHGEINRGIEKIYQKCNQNNACSLDNEWDIIVIHDPQPAAIPCYRNATKTKWIWRCHIDTSKPNKSIWKFFKNFFKEYDAAIFTIREFVPKDFPIKKVFFIPPAIDPLDIKNKPLSFNIAKKIISSFGIDIKRPLITQISRFDPWKDPVGVIKCYKVLKRKFKGLQLALVSIMCDDDPEASEIYLQLVKLGKKDKDIHILTNRDGINNKEVNAFQSFSDVILQKSIREGFGLAVSEALWKGTPVIAGNVGGIKLQVQNGKNGFLVNNEKQCIEKTLLLLQNPQMARKMGKWGKEYVKKHFLLPRLLKDELKIYSKLVRTK